MTVFCVALALIGAPCARGGHASAPPARGGAAIVLSNVELGEWMAARRGWRGEQWTCLYRLWNRESGWQVVDPRGPDPADVAAHRTTRAYGIVQSLPGWKMASAGPAWLLDAATQIRWGLGYIAARYGSPCAAYAHSNAWNFY